MIKEVLKDYKCPRMARAWRNRSLVTRLQWVGFARKILINADSQELWKYAACLYIACGPEDFDGNTADFNKIEKRFQEYLINTPEKALERDQL